MAIKYKYAHFLYRGKGGFSKLNRPKNVEKVVSIPRTGRISNNDDHPQKNKTERQSNGASQ